MSFKSDIKKAITANTRYKAVKVWSREVEPSQILGGDKIMMIEVSVRSKKRTKKHSHDR
jgi:quercetin dioxygenase-like cupin family protein